MGLEHHKRLKNILGCPIFSFFQVIANIFCRGPGIIFFQIYANHVSLLIWFMCLGTGVSVEAVDPVFQVINKNFLFQVSFLKDRLYFKSCTPDSLLTFF